AAERGGEQTVLAEALRRLAVVRRHRSEVAAATALCQRSYEVARQAGDDLLAAEALNTLGGLYLSTGAPDDARRVFLEALELGGSNREVRARVEQNLGILANIRGELHEAIARYERSLDAYRDCGRGSAPRSNWPPPRAPCSARRKPRGSWPCCIKPWHATRKRSGCSTPPPGCSSGWTPGWT